DEPAPAGPVEALAGGVVLELRRGVGSGREGHHDELDLFPHRGGQCRLDVLGGLHEQGAGRRAVPVDHHEPRGTAAQGGQGEGAAVLVGPRAGEVEQRGAGQGAGRQRRLVAGMMVVRRVRHGLLPVTRRARSVRRGNVGDVGRVVGHGGRGGGAVLAAGGEQRGERGGGGGE